MKDLSTFASADYPLHPSGMRTMIVCPWRAAMEHLFADDGDGSGGPAADTGSAMHAAAAAFHRGESVASSIEAMGEGLAKYPRADLTEAAAMFLNYSRDTRNSEATVLLVEETVRFAIAPHETDPTGAPIEVMATIDQVREENGRLIVTDIKTSKRDPFELLLDHTFQVAAYCAAAAFKLNRRVDGAQLICPRKYTANVNSSPVFWRYAWGWADVEHILEVVRKRVADIRSGHVYHVPNSDCKWCPSRTPDNCLPALKEFRQKKISLV